MSTECVSILLPNLNKADFIDERIHSLQNQTFSNWECVVVDSFSDDGSAEKLAAWARQDRRVRFIQAPRDGLYRNWNRALEQAQNDLIYIATSDDTMHREFLEQTVSALQAHPEAGLCATRLEVIDEQSKPIAGRWEQALNNNYYGDWLHRAHYRSADLEAVRLLCLGILHTAMNGLLIRRSLFTETGDFPLDYGNAGDMAWQHRALPLRDTLYLPQPLAQFRHYHGQATATIPDYHSVTARLIEEHIGSTPPDYQAAVDLSLRAFKLGAQVKESQATATQNLKSVFSDLPASRLLLLRTAVYRGLAKWACQTTHRKLVPLSGIRPL